MKIVKDSINRSSMEGTIKLEPEEEEDMYFLYQLISAGDEVEALTVRNVVSENKTGTKTKTRVLFKIRIAVEKIDFDAEQGALRLNGRNICESEYIKMYQFHTVEIELGRSLKISKEHWDSVCLDILDEAANPIRKADVAAITIQEGLSYISLIKTNLTKTCAKVERSLKKQKEKSSNYEDAVRKFYHEIYNAVKMHINFDSVKAVLVGSPGFFNEEFYQYMIAAASLEECSDILKNKSKFICVHTSVGHLRAIEEMLSNESVREQLGDIKSLEQVKSLDRFHRMMGSDPDRICYGFEQVVAADEQLAIEELLITDAVYRTNDYAKRKTFISLMESVAAHGGKIHKFSSLHASGQQLDLYTGIASILRFPLPDVAEEEAADSSDNDFEVCKAAYTQISAHISELTLADQEREKANANKGRKSRSSSLVDSELGCGGDKARKSFV